MNATKYLLFALLTVMFSCQDKHEIDHKIEFVADVKIQPESNYLIKVHEGEYDELGAVTGYVNLQGDTVIPMGKYHYCYTDTLKNYAIVLKKGGGCIAIDREDNELYEVFWFDNGPDYVADGLFRIKKNDKIGYANEAGQVIIQPQFPCAYYFENGKAKVAYDCSEVQDFEHFRWESDAWFYIDLKGNKIEE